MPRIPSHPISPIAVQDVYDNICDMMLSGVRSPPICDAAAQFLTQGDSISSQCEELLRCFAPESANFEALSELTPEWRREALGDVEPIFTMALQLLEPSLAQAQTHSGPSHPPPMPDFGSWQPSDENGVAAVQNGLENLRCTSPEELNHPVLCGDGGFYARELAVGSELDRHGIMDCENHPDIKAGEWWRLTQAVPCMVPRVKPALLGAMATAFLATADPQATRPGDHLWAFYERLQGGTFDDGVSCMMTQRCALEQVRWVCVDRWLEFADLMRECSPSLARMGDQMGAVTHRLALEQAALYPEAVDGRLAALVLSPSIRLGLAQGMIADDLPAANEGLVRASLEAICTRWVNGQRVSLEPRDTDTHDALRLVQIFGKLSLDELENVLGCLKDLTGSDICGSTATLHDVANIAAALQAMPTAAHRELARSIPSAYAEEGASLKIWEVFGLLCESGHADMSAPLRVASDLLAHMREDGTHSQLMAFLRVATQIPEDRLLGTSELVQSLVPGQRGLDVEELNAVAINLSRFSAEDQGILQQERGQLEQDIEEDGKTRLELLSSFDFVTRFCISQRLPPGMSRGPVVIREIHRAPVDVETVMDRARMLCMVQDIETIQTWVPQEQRWSTREALDRIEAYLVSPAVERLAQLPQRADQNERSHAQRALRELGPTLTGVNLGQETPYDVDMVSVCALIWQTISRYESSQGAAATLRDRDNMFYSVAAGLAQCIEADGHMVCPWGQGQRLLAALGGHGLGLRFEANVIRPTPAELLTQLSAEFARQVAAAGQDEPTDAEVDVFCRRSLGCAQAVLIGDEVAAFQRRLVEYLTITEWNLPSCLA